MSVAVVIPYDSIDPWRQRAYETVRRYYQTEFPRWPIFTPRLQYPNLPIAAALSRARNVALDLAIEIVIFNDADSLAPPDNLLHAVSQARAAPGLVFAWDNYQRLSQRATAEIIPSGYLDAFTLPVEWEMYGSLSAGCMAIRTENFREVHGFDESWADGYEDFDFALRCNERWRTRRVSGDLVHLWHPRPDVEPEAGRDRARYETLYLGR